MLIMHAYQLTLLSNEMSVFPFLLTDPNKWSETRGNCLSKCELKIFSNYHKLLFFFQLHRWNSFRNVLWINLDTNQNHRLLPILPERATHFQEKWSFLISSLFYSFTICKLQCTYNFLGTVYLRAYSLNFISLVVISIRSRPPITLHCEPESDRLFLKF